MIGDTPDEMMAFYLGLCIGILVGLHFLLIFAIWWNKKYSHLLNNDNIASKKDTMASIKDIRNSKIIPIITKFTRNNIIATISATVPESVPSLYEKNITKSVTASTINNKTIAMAFASLNKSVSPIKFSLIYLYKTWIFKCILWVLLVRWYLIDLASMISPKRTQYNTTYYTPLNLHPSTLQYQRKSKLPIFWFLLIMSGIGMIGIIITLFLLTFV